MSFKFHYVSNARFMRDINLWSLYLPKFDFIVGVPRGGAIPAVLISSRQNVKMLSLDLLFSEADKPTGILDNKRILVVDDNVSMHGTTFTIIRQRLSSLKHCHIEYGAVYSTGGAILHHAYRECQPPIFEFDWHRRFYVEHVGVDLDGVLSEDYNPPEKEGDDPVYARHLTDACCLVVPRDPVAAIVTGRLEKHRKATVAWLEKHNIKYRELIMYPSDSADVRRQKGDAWMRKAQFLSRGDIWFFVESDHLQSTLIHNATGKAVLCTADGNMYQ